MIIASALFALGVALLSYLFVQVLSSGSRNFRNNFTENAKLNLSELFLFIEPEKILLLNIAAVILTFLVVWIFSGLWFVALLASLVVFVSPKFVFHFLKKKRRQRIVTQLPDMLFAIARSMKAGSSLIQAIEIAVEEETGPIAQEFSLFMREIRIGTSFDEAMDNMSNRVGAEEINLVASGMKISREIGGNLAETLDRLADTIRRKIEMEGKIDALTAQGKMQGLVMALLPMLVGFALFHIEPDHMGRLFSEPIGWAVIVVVLFMECLGFFFIRKIVSIDV